MIDVEDEAAAEAWLDSMGVNASAIPETHAAMKTAYLAGIAAERERTNDVFWGMARRIAAQSDLLTRKAKRG